MMGQNNDTNKFKYKIIFIGQNFQQTNVFVMLLCLVFFRNVAVLCYINF